MSIRDLKSDELSHRLWETGKARADADRHYIYCDEKRKILLAELTIQYEKDNGVTKAQSMARIDPEFQNFALTEYPESKRALSQARADYAECDFEIKRRLNLSFSKNREWNAEKGNT